MTSLGRWSVRWWLKTSDSFNNISPRQYWGQLKIVASASLVIYSLSTMLLMKKYLRTNPVMSCCLDLTISSSLFVLFLQVQVIICSGWECLSMTVSNIKRAMSHWVAVVGLGLLTPLGELWIPWSLNGWEMSVIFESSSTESEAVS